MFIFKKERLWALCKAKTLNISEIVTETSTEPSPIWLEEEDIEGLQKRKGKIISENREKKFIT